MSIRFITSILSIGALIATVSAVPAKAADPDDVGKVLAGAATLFILGKIIQQETRDDRQTQKAHQVQRYEPRRQVVTPRRQEHNRYRDGHGGRDRRAALPRQCLIPVSGAGTRYVLGARCLERNYRSAHRLPRSCEVTLEGRRHDRSAYSMRCLRRNGFELASR